MKNINRFAALPALAIICFAVITAVGQQAEFYPAFTLRSQVTDYDAGGNAVIAFNETRFFSSTGSWRYVGEYPGGNVIETIYRHREGVYVADNKSRQLIKISEAGSGRPQPATAEQLRADPKFIRVEPVLSLLACVHRQKIDNAIEETYFAPELGRVPLKRITTFANGYKRVEEPLSLEMEEPMFSQLIDDDYLRIEKIPVFSGKIVDRLPVKTSPEYPAQALTRGISGSVIVQVIVDERGKVISARVASIPLPFLDEAAINAAYQEQFSALAPNAEQVKVQGLIKYYFAPPKISPSNKPPSQ